MDFSINWCILVSAATHQILTKPNHLTTFFLFLGILHYLPCCTSFLSIEASKSTYSFNINGKEPFYNLFFGGKIDHANFTFPLK